MPPTMRRPPLGVDWLRSAPSAALRSLRYASPPPAAEGPAPRKPTMVFPISQPQGWDHFRRGSGPVFDEDFQEPHDEAAIKSLAKPYEAEGQLQPVQVRRVADNRVQLVMGYRRHAAVVEFNKVHPDKPMKLKAIVVTINAEEAFRRNIVENRERQETTPIDDAFNQRRLRDDYGWTDTKIAEFYALTAPYVGVLRKLLTLPTETQKLVHARQLSVKAAAALTELSPEEQQKAIEPAQPDATPMKTDLAEKMSSRVVKAVRVARIEKGGKQARSLAEVRKFFEGMNENPPVKALAGMMLEFIQGRLTDETMASNLNSLFPDKAPAPSETAV
jgi:ParB/RepB/Spo0J family partition protein